MISHELFDAKEVTANVLDLQEQTSVMPIIHIKRLESEDGDTIAYYKDPAAVQRRDNANPILCIIHPSSSFSFI